MGEVWSRKKQLEKVLKEIDLMREDEQIHYIMYGEDTFKTRHITIVLKKEGEE